MPTINKSDRYLGEVIDERPGAYYVSVIDAGCYGLLAGPFDTHNEALAMVDSASAKAREVDPRAAFYAFGTCRMDKPAGPGGIKRSAGHMNIEPTDDGSDIGDRWDGLS